MTTTNEETTRKTGALTTPPALSAQKAAIASGSKMLRPGFSDRVVRLFDAIRSYGPPRVALERAVFFTESFKTTEGQPLVWRWAKALHWFLNRGTLISDLR